jgi:Co/Zn/Cd efflux system component
LLTGLVEFNSIALLAENLEMTSDNSGNCLAWAARDKSGFLSPHTFNRRYAYNRESPCFFLGN